jgi:hypothetical protein
MVVQVTNLQVTNHNMNSWRLARTYSGLWTQRVEDHLLVSGSTCNKHLTTATLHTISMEMVLSAAA